MLPLPWEGLRPGRRNLGLLGSGGGDREAGPLALSRVEKTPLLSSGPVNLPTSALQRLPLPGCPEARNAISSASLPQPSPTLTSPSRIPCQLPSPAVSLLPHPVPPLRAGSFQRTSQLVPLVSSTCLYTGISARLMPWLLCPIAPPRFLGTHPTTLCLSHTTRSLAQCPAHQASEKTPEMLWKG